MEKITSEQLKEVAEKFISLDFGTLNDALRVAGNCQAGLKNQAGLDSLTDLIGNLWELEYKIDILKIFLEHENKDSQPSSEAQK